LLLVESISDYSKRDIDIGKTPIDVYRLISCIRETFCLSYALRKENNLFIYIEKDFSLIKLKGKELRYLGPDERSETLLLMKALEQIKKNSKNYFNKWTLSTPGIFIRTFFDSSSFMNYYRLLANHIGYMVVDDSFNDQDIAVFFETDKDPIEIIENDFFIIPTYSLRSATSRCIKLFRELKNTKFISLSKIKNFEDLILYINFRKDLQNTHNITVK
jgi:hypothetical protein